MVAVWSVAPLSWAAGPRPLRVGVGASPGGRPGLAWSSGGGVWVWAATPGWGLPRGVRCSVRWCLGWCPPPLGLRARSEGGGAALLAVLRLADSTPARRGSGLGFGVRLARTPVLSPGGSGLGAAAVSLVGPAGCGPWLRPCRVPAWRVAPCVGVWGGVSSWGLLFWGPAGAVGGGLCLAWLAPSWALGSCLWVGVFGVVLGLGCVVAALCALWLFGSSALCCVRSLLSPLVFLPVLLVLVPCSPWTLLWTLLLFRLLFFRLPLFRCAVSAGPCNALLTYRTERITWPQQARLVC